VYVVYFAAHCVDVMAHKCKLSTIEMQTIAV